MFQRERVTSGTRSKYSHRSIFDSSKEVRVSLILYASITQALDNSFNWPLYVWFLGANLHTSSYACCVFKSTDAALDFQTDKLPARSWVVGSRAQLDLLENWVDFHNHWELVEAWNSCWQSTGGRGGLLRGKLLCVEGVSLKMGNVDIYHQGEKNSFSKEIGKRRRNSFSFFYY